MLEQRAAGFLLRPRARYVLARYGRVVGRSGEKTFTRGVGKHPPVSWFAVGWLLTNARHLLASTFAVDDSTRATG